MNHQQNNPNILSQVLNTTVYDPRLTSYVVNIPPDNSSYQSFPSTSLASSTDTSTNQIIQVIEPNELYSTFLEINPANAKIYFEKCSRFNVTLNHLQKITEQHMSRMFPEDSELGLLIEFSDDIRKWKILHKLESNSDERHFDEQNYRQDYSFINIISLNIKLKEKATSRVKDGIKKKLTKKDRSIMLTLIVEYFRNFRKDKLSYETMQMLADDIEYYFSEEPATTYFYFCKSENGKKRAKGKLFNRWNNRNDREEPKKEKMSKTENKLEEIYNTSRLSITNINNKQDQEKIKLNLAAPKAFL